MKSGYRSRVSQCLGRKIMVSRANELLDELVLQIDATTRSVDRFESLHSLEVETRRFYSFFLFIESNATA